VFEISDDSQVIAKYLDARLQLGLFPRELEGVQSLLWRFIENEIEGAAFRLNDIYWQEFVPRSEHLAWLRHKERKFGRGCVEQWRGQQGDWLKRLEQNLIPFEEMVMHQPFLLGQQPRFVDFDLYGMLENFLYTGHYRLPKAHNHLRNWHRRMAQLKMKNEK
jgi:glutathione S-transferase